MAAIEVEFDVWCSCGSGLDRGTSVEPGNSRRLAQVTIEPCESCLDAERKPGYDEGYRDGHDEGHATGHDEGYSEGYDDALLDHSEGYNDALLDSAPK